MTNIPNTDRSNTREYSKQLIFVSLIKSWVIIKIKRVPIKISILKKFVNELETKLSENNLKVSLKEFRIINIRAITIP